MFVRYKIIKYNTFLFCKKKKKSSIEKDPSPRHFRRQTSKKAATWWKKKIKINKKLLYLRDSRQAGRQTRGRFSGAGSYHQLLRGRSTPMEGWKRQFSRGFRENERNRYTHFSMPWIFTPLQVIQSNSNLGRRKKGGEKYGEKRKKLHCIVPYFLQPSKLNDRCDI